MKSLIGRAREIHIIIVRFRFITTIRKLHQYLMRFDSFAKYRIGISLIVFEVAVTEVGTIWLRVKKLELHSTTPLPYKFCLLSAINSIAFRKSSIYDGEPVSMP